jgi:hypothetical protein
MKKTLSPAGMFTAGVVITLVLTGGGVAYAANGGSLIIGKANSGSKMTKLSSPGTPLKLSSRHGAPLKVNSSRKVAKLNADKLDGVDFRTGRTRVLGGSGAYVDVNADGVNDAFVASAQCPRGSLLTGGGADDFTDGYKAVDSPTDDGLGWIAAVVSDTGASQPNDLVAFALCYDPFGGPTGTTFKSTSGGHVTLSDKDKAGLLRAAAAKAR